MSAASDHPLSVLDSLRGLITAFRLLGEWIDLDATTISVRVAGAGGEILAEPSLARLLGRAEAAAAAEELARRTQDVPGAHSPLPWWPSERPDEPLTLYDAIGTRILGPEGWADVPHDEAAADVALIARATAAHPRLLAILAAAAQALRSYQHGNDAPDPAQEVADAIEATVAQLETR